MHHYYYLQDPSSCKHLGLWNGECSLCMLVSWASVSSLTNFKLPWNTTTLKVPGTAKHCSDLTFVHR